MRYITINMESTPDGWQYQINVPELYLHVTIRGTMPEDTEVAVKEFIASLMTSFRILSINPGKGQLPWHGINGRGNHPTHGMANGHMSMLSNGVGTSGRARRLS